MLEAIIGAAGVLAGSLLTWMFNRRKDLTSAYQELVNAQESMQREIDAQDAKLEKFISQRDRLQTILDMETGYLRSLGHWLAQFCEVIDPEFLARHPKPHVPDELRDRLVDLDVFSGVRYNGRGNETDD